MNEPDIRDPDTPSSTVSDHVHRQAKQRLAAHNPKKETAMQPKVITITVAGETGSGKSEVLEVIAEALRNFYQETPEKILVAGKVSRGAISQAAATGQTANKKGVLFFLREDNVVDGVVRHE